MCRKVIDSSKSWITADPEVACRTIGAQKLVPLKAWGVTVFICLKCYDERDTEGLV